MLTIITIRLNDGGTLPVRAVVRGPLAIHRTLLNSGAYAVTHVASGLLITTFPTGLAARRFLLAIQDWPEWRKSAKRLITPGEANRRLARKVLRVLRVLKAGRHG